MMLSSVPATIVRPWAVRRFMPDERRRGRTTGRPSPKPEESTNQMHLLVVEDDVRLGPLLQRLLREDRHVVELTTRGGEAFEMATGLEGFDAIVLDIGLPDGSGLDVARRLRRDRIATPILVLTARDTVNDRVAGLDAGADDYLVKPFAYQELAARLRALSRRAAGTAADGAILSCGAIELDDRRHVVCVAGRPIGLSAREFALLETLMRRQGAVLSRDQLLDHAWPSSVAVTPNTVDAFVVLLRRKLGPEGARQLETIRGVGYRLVP
jgi:two-component system OmpR family response regulator